MVALPPLTDLPAKPRLLIWHWTAGFHEASDHDRTRYHLLIEHWEGKYRIQRGVPIARNLREVEGLPGYHHDPETGYAAHTRAMNSYAIGVALCGMVGAVDRRPDGDVRPGEHPITEVQVEGLVELCAEIGAEYWLEPEPRQMLGHCEVPEVYGVAQPGKWDVSWWRGYEGAAEDAGDRLRERIREEMEG